MTKSSSERGREALELVDELPGGPRAIPHAWYRYHRRRPETFEDFYRHEYPRLLVLARALAGDLAAEDVAQESMIAAYRQWSQIVELD